jgi:hypothetical protein
VINEITRLRAAKQLFLAAFIGVFSLLFLHKPSAAKELTSAQRKDFEARLEKLRPLLNEYKQGKRDDVDGNAIMHQMLQYYGILGSSTTAECQQLLAEWRALQQKHPEYRADPPLEISEHRVAREVSRKHHEDITAKAANFVPKDSVASVFWSGRNIAAVFQHRIEFYELPEGVDCVAPFRSPENVKPISLHRREGTRLDNLHFRGPSGEFSTKPKKTITFGRRVQIAKHMDHAAKNISAFAVLAYGSGYVASEAEEQEVLQELDKRKQQFAWNGSGADYQEFYGVLSVDGRILARIPFKASAPESVMEALYSGPDGESVFGIGKYVEIEDSSAEGPSSVFGGVSEIVVWSPLRGIAHLTVAQAMQQYPVMKEWPNGLWAK